MSEIVVPRQFRGPPFTANGGYICGLLAGEAAPLGSAMLRSGVPLDVALPLTRAEDGTVTLTNAEGVVLAVAKPSDGSAIPEVPAPPSLQAARIAGEGSPFARRSLHRGCFSCCIERDDALGVYVGQVEGAPVGQCAGVWTPDAQFADAHGTIPDAITWGALDCPGSMAWFVKSGSPVGLLGTMAGEVLDKPRAGETYIVSAWALEADGRKHFAGVALHDASGKLMARAGQIWIGRPPGAPMFRPGTTPPDK
jgi:hypothetical protein